MPTSNTARLITIALTMILISRSGSLLSQSNSKTYKFSDSVSFQIDRIEEFKGFGTGNGFVYPTKGFKFVGAFVTFTNNSSEKQEVNMTNIYLADPENTVKYRVEFVMKTGPFTFIQRAEKPLKAGKSIDRKLVFSIPKEMKAGYLLVNDELVKIE